MKRLYHRREIFSFTKWIKTFALLMVLLCTTATRATDYNVGTDSELRAAIENNNANITVTADIDLSNSTLAIPANNTVTIDLNSHKLDRNLTQRGESGATLNLSNGTLKGGWGGNGGGLVNEGGTANLTDVTITGNVAVDRGGGISNQGTLNMTGGAITDNTCQDNTAPRGGGGINNWGTLTIDGCTITGNTSNANGGGIWNGPGSTINMQGKNTITDNQRNGNTNNVFLRDGVVITVTGSLAESQIGISMAEPGILTNGYSTYNQGVVPATYFESDNANYEIASSNGECLLQKKIGTSINSIDSDANHADGVWYDLSGRKIANGKKPTAKGVYIYNGKKII